MILIHIVNFIFNVLLTASITVIFYYCLAPKYSFFVSMLPNIIMGGVLYILFSILLENSSFILFKTLIVILYFMIYASIFYKDSIKHKITIVIFSQMITIIADTLTGIIMINLVGADIFLKNVFFKMIGFTLVTIFLLILYPLFIHFFKKFTKRDTIQHFGTFILFPISQIMLIIVATYILGIRIDDTYGINSLNKMKTEFAIIVIFAIICIVISVIADIILYRVQKENSTNDKLKENLELADYRNKLELQYYQQMQDNIEETRKIRHDFYNILSTMNDANKISGELKDEIETALINSSTASVCENNIVNLIILNKNKICLENGIELDADLDISEDISLSKLDLLRVFSNILDNAIEANLKSDNSKKRFINLSAKIRDNYLLISAKNPLSSEVIKHNKKYETTKKQKNSHGFGMIILDDIAKKYDGELIVENDKNNFTTLISLKIE